MSVAPGGLNGCGRMGARVQEATGRPLAGRAPDPTQQGTGQGSRRPRRPERPEPGRRWRGVGRGAGQQRGWGAAEPRQHDKRRAGACRGRGRCGRTRTTRAGAHRRRQERHGCGGHRESMAGTGRVCGRGRARARPLTHRAGSELGACRGAVQAQRGEEEERCSRGGARRG